MKHGEAVVEAASDYYGYQAALESLHHLGLQKQAETRLDMHVLFSTLSCPPASASLRDLEPLMGAFLRLADPVDDLGWLVDDHKMMVAAKCDDKVRRAGYVLDLLCLFSPVMEQWQDAGLMRWLDSVSASLSEDMPKFPYFPEDRRNTAGMDFIVDRWRLSSGVLYDRLKRLLRFPYVC